jgi:hypothetical protein
MHEYMHNRGVPPAAWQGPLLKGFRIPPTYTGVGNLQKECCTSSHNQSSLKNNVE